MELKPEWNIKVTIVLPGGFRTDFIHRSLVFTTPTPAYEGSPASAMRHLVQVASGNEEGDPAKAAQAIITIAHHDNPPLRLPVERENRKRKEKAKKAFSVSAFKA